MKIINARWTERVNILIISCFCGKTFEHPANRQWMRCPSCRRGKNLHDLRREELTTVSLVLS
jgi:hypothetical protein